MIKYCRWCDCTKLVGRCEKCERVKAPKVTSEDLRVDFPEVVNVENVMKEK